MPYRHLRPALLAFAAALVVAACGVEEPGDAPLDPVDFYGEAGHADVEDPIDFTETNYDFTGEMPIADLVDLINQDESVWYGMSPEDPYSHGDEQVTDVDCDPDEQRYENRVEEIGELPEYIEGIATLRPRYFQKVPVCGQDQRFYGSFYLQDESGGILVLKDARIEDFQVGERVRLRVRGITKYFDSRAVLAFDEQEVVEPGTRHPIYYEEADGPLDDDAIGEVHRVTGVITSEPTNDNFNELRMVNQDDDTEYVVGIDRELALQGLELAECQRIEVTGPVELSFGDYRVIVSNRGQIKWLDEDACPDTE